MEGKEVKEAYSSAEKELKEEETKKVKEVIKATLEKMKKLQIDKMKLDKQIKILKKDIEDFKEGRLDRIAERQQVDEEAKETSVFTIEKKVVEEHHHYYDRWYWPYVVEIKPQPLQVWYRIPPSTTTVDTSSVNCDYYSDATSSVAVQATINCSVAKDATGGTYKLSDGTIKYL